MDIEHSLGIGIGLVVAAAVFWWLCRRSSKRLQTILETPTVACRDIPGLGADTVEVVGLTRVRQPLLADLTRAACVSFNCCVTEHWTTTETESDGKDGTRTVTRYHSAVRYQNAQRIPFDVVDASGFVLVEPAGAEIEMLATAAGPAPPGSPAFGVSAMNFGGYLTYSESVLPVAHNVYVLAEVSERNTLVKPETLKEPFIISPRTEAQLISSAKWGRLCFGALAMATLLGGLGLLGLAYDLHLHPMR